MPKTKQGATPKRGKVVRYVPVAYAGKWVAWSPQGPRVVAVANTLKACVTAAARAGFREDQVAFEKVPPSNQRLIG